jgi:hypothetical protein
MSRRRSEPCMCGAPDCRRCFPENFDRRGRYIYAECKTCGGEFVPEDEEDDLCAMCKAKIEEQDD